MNKPRHSVRNKELDYTSYLLDEDGDGFFDALKYQISLPSKPRLQTVIAATEIAMYLAGKLLAMPHRPWVTTNDNLPPAAIYMGPEDMLYPLIEGKEGSRVISNEQYLFLIAEDPASLLSTARKLISSLEVGGRNHQQSTISTTRFGLGNIFDFPSHIIINTTDLRTVDAAARIAFEGSAHSASDVNSINNISFNDKGNTLTLISENEISASGSGLSYLADNYPYVPGNIDLTQLECSLNETFMLNSQHARVAALLARKPRAKQAAFLPHPPTYTNEILDNLVVDSAEGKTIRSWKLHLPWEGRRLQERIRSLSVPQNAQVEVIATLGESQRVRAILEKELYAQLAGRGHDARVVLRSTLKPAVCWLREEVLPQAQSRRADTVVVTCSRWDREGLEPTSRWLRDLYPLDALLDKHYPRMKLAMRIDKQQTVPYRVVALRDGHAVLEEELDPQTSEKDYLPGDTRRVHPVCGWLSVRADEEVIASEALPTDAELFWDWYQREVLPEVISLFGQGMAFADLEVKLEISEPDDRLSILQERISGIEALHEDIYFVTLDAFKAATGERPESRSLLTGRIVPVVTARDQEDTHAEVVLTAPGGADIAWNDSDGSIYPPSIETKIVQIRVDEDSLPVEVSLDFSAKDEGEALFALDLLSSLHDLEASAHIPPWERTLPRGIELEVSAKVDGMVVGRRTLHSLPIDAEEAALGEVPRRNLSPDESAELTWRAGSLPHVRAQLAGRSYQGRPIVSLELTYPARASKSKLASWKPTVLITARQHANEISSTNAALETARIIAIEEHEYLKYMNIVIVPMENPDGAHLYCELAKENPGHLLHAARYTALGADLQTAIWQVDHPLSEGSVRRHLWRKWAPLIHINDHGYAGHEWQQPFSGTVPYLFPSWSLPMGALTILMHTEEHADLAQRFERTIASVFNELEPGITANTGEAFNRAERYGNSACVRTVSGLPFMEVVGKEDAESSVFSRRYPSITPLTVVTELPDEGVDAEKLGLCIRAHRAQHEGVIRALLAELKRDL